MDWLILGILTIIGVLFFTAVINIIRFGYSLIMGIWRALVGVMRWVLPIVCIFPLVLSPPKPANAQLLAIGAGMYDHSIPQIQYTGSGITWTNQTSANAFGGSYRFSSLTTTTNPKIEFNIYGDGFVLYIFQNAFGANANLCINAICNGITYYAPSDTFTTLSVTGLGFGTHNIVIQKTSTNNTLITLDGLYVAPPAPYPTNTPAPTPTGTQGVYVINMPGSFEEATPTYQQAIDIGGVPTVVQYVVSPMDVIVVFLLVLVVFFVIIGFVIKLRGKV